MRTIGEIKELKIFKCDSHYVAVRKMEICCFVS